MKKVTLVGLPPSRDKFANSIFKIGAGAGVGVAFYAAQTGVFASQRKNQGVMVKGLAQRFHAIMTVQAIFSVFNTVRGHKDGVHLLVAVGTLSLLKRDKPSAARRGPYAPSGRSGS